MQIPTPEQLQEVGRQQRRKAASKGWRKRLDKTVTRNPQICLKLTELELSVLQTLSFTANLTPSAFLRQYIMQEGNKLPPRLLDELEKRAAAKELSRRKKASSE